MKILNKIKNFLTYWGENFIVAPFVLCLTYAAIVGFNTLTGRPVIDSPDIIVGWLYLLVKSVLIMMATGFAQNFLVGYRSKHAGASMKDDIFDFIVTVTFFGFFVYLFSN